MMEKPQVILLDAVGTLFGVRGSVGEVYSAIASEFGVSAPSDALHTAFVKSFVAADPMVSSEMTQQSIPQQEYVWWEAIARATFTHVGVYEQFSDFSAFFQSLYAYFATEKPWFIYPDVLPALKGWQAQGIELGIVSNFDSRLHSVLDALELRNFFSHITISSEVGVAKPEAKIFQAALAKHHCPSEKVWHIGDSLKDDYQGAKAVGIRAFLLQRAQPLL